MGSSPSKKTEAIKETSQSSSSGGSGSGSETSSNVNIPPNQKAVANSNTMPFFRKQSENAKKRLQHQQYLVNIMLYKHAIYV